MRNASCLYVTQRSHFQWDKCDVQVSNLGMLQTYYRSAYALIRPACPACFVAISPRVYEQVTPHGRLVSLGVSDCVQTH